MSTTPFAATTTHIADEASYRFCRVVVEDPGDRHPDNHDPPVVAQVLAVVRLVLVLSVLLPVLVGSGVPGVGLHCPGTPVTLTHVASPCWVGTSTNRSRLIKHPKPLKGNKKDPCGSFELSKTI